jgi:hypothetical protein
MKPHKPVQLTDLEVAQMYASLPQPAADIFICSQPDYAKQAIRFAKSQFIDREARVKWLWMLGHPGFRGEYIRRTK